METVAAVVVTYNRIGDLKKCLISLQQQTRTLNDIIVINNGSTDGTGEWLAAQPGLTVVTQPNLGGAGGFATGIDHAHKAGFDWVWCMDDDCLAAPTALEHLLASPNIGPCIKNSISVSTRDDNELAFFVDRPHQSYRKVTDMTQFDLVYGVASFFNGTLISAAVINSIGIPDAKLFIWGDEVEYMTRAEKMGYPVITVTKSVFYHPPSFDRNGIPWPGAWKQYYAVRNQRRIFQNIHGDRYGMLLFIKWSMRAAADQIVTTRKNWFYNFMLYGEAITDGVFNNFSKKPTNIVTVRLYHRLNPATQPVNKSVLSNA